MSTDAISVAVLRNGLEAIAEEMNATLVRTAYSPNITERRDCSTAIFDSAGELLSQAETMPVHLGAMPFSVAGVLEAYPAETLDPGDALLANDPFRGGAHLPDLTLVTPIYVAGELVAFAANRAHHADIGGARAGSIGADSTEIYQEGLRIPPVKLYEGGDCDEDILEMVCANVRTPAERRGDLRAQHAANQTARQRLEALLSEYDSAERRELLTEIQAYSRRRMQSALAELPDGEYAFGDLLDDDGQGVRDLPIQVEVTLEGESVTVDFTGSAPQTTGPLNAVFAVTASATYYAIRCLTDPEIPPNAGCYEPIEIHAPEGTICNPEPPAAVVGGNLETSQRITDVVLGALAPAVPERAVAAGQGTMNNVTFGGTDPRDGSPFAFYETEAGGFGARATRDGMDAVHVHMSNTQNTPVEVLETAYPLRVTQYALRPGSGGAGKHRGGDGVRRDIEVRADDTSVSVLADRRRHQPYGLFGGEPGECGETVLYPPSETAGDVLPAKTTRVLDAGAVLSIRTPGGGGYGEPAERARDSDAQDH